MTNVRQTSGDRIDGQSKREDYWRRRFFPPQPEALILRRALRPIIVRPAA